MYIGHRRTTNANDDDDDDDDVRIHYAVFPSVFQHSWLGDGRTSKK